jgi:hypothetical protein
MDPIGFALENFDAVGTWRTREAGAHGRLGGQAAPNTVDTLQKQLENPQVVQAKLDDPVKQVDLGVVTGLVLGAPEFQRR